MEWFISLWTLGIISFYTGEAVNLQEQITKSTFNKLSTTLDPRENISTVLPNISSSQTPPHNKSLYTSPFCPPCRCLEDRVTIDCSNSSLTSIPNYPAQSSDDDYEDEGGGSLIESLILPSNKITHVDLEFLRHYPKLTSLILRSNAIRSLSKSSTDYQPFFGLIHVDLSNNHLHVLHSYVFSGFPSLKTLNLSSNVIHTVSQMAFSLPSLQTIDLSGNSLSFIEDHFFDSSPNLSEIDLSKNKLSRLNDGTFGLLRHLSLLDLSHNSLMKIEDNVLVGMNITHLDLGHNSLRKVPTLALRKLTSIKTLLLDGNLFSVLESGSISNVRAEFLSLSHNPHLIRLDDSAIDNCHTLETLTVNNNPNLIYVHPRVVKRAPVLAAMDLSFNGLYSLESQIIKEIPSLKALSLAGNNFKCHCSLKWIGKLTQSSSTSNLRLLTPNSVVCKMDDHSSPLPLNVDSTGMNEECQPYILPLFLDNSTELMGKNASWMCKALGSSKMDLTWKLPSLHKERRVVGNGECLERVCVENNVLKIAYLHLKDAGRYTCVARNKYGQDQRGVQLNVRSENIQIFPVTVASRFVTLSWNTSTHLSTGRGYILQVKREEHADSNKDSRFPRNSPIVKQYEDIDVGLKMNSYTVNGLDPGQTYRFLLCLRKGEYVLTISSAVLKTKNPGYEVELGIETDYVSLLSVCIALSGLVASCISMILFRWVRYHRGHKDLDTISTREMITSPSDHSSITGIHYTLGDESRLMDNEVTSPVEDMRETRT